MKRRHKLYLDNCILFPFYYEKDKRNKNISKFIKEISKLKNIILCISDFNYVELVKSSADERAISFERVNEIISNIERLSKIGKKYPVEIVRVEGKEKSYDFPDLFVHIQQIIINSKPRIPIADAIHSSIMINNKIKYIITFDKKHFEKVEGIKPLTPEEAINFFQKKKK
jgi:predicted nucleic acid-binding protein